MNDPHETMYENDIAPFTWKTIDEMLEMENAVYYGRLFKETEDKREEPF